MLRKSLIALGLIALAGGAVADPSVVDAYRDIRRVTPDLTYDLRQQGNGWVTTSPDWGTALPITVNGPAGFVEIMDEGTGGGSYRTQIVLWRAGDGTPLVGIGETAYTPPWPDTTRVRFFGKDGENWSDWTDYVWPDVTLADFMPDDMRISDLRALEAIRAQVFVTLPQKGTRPVAQLITHDSEIAAVCKGETWFVPSDPAPYLTYCDRLQDHLFHTLDLDWIKSEARFEKGGLSR
ncbi:hypothetical protein [Aliiroseovarius subalbicans]|uniref:hypothetical protein n=1 Tax=Aliiroseovarius subalbicans TaxID=2925840 RepID=UPI001F564F65|nr:hypothetical protein [Aliiroseovarius subalbicans]MCI2398742.1 hypothetical protein [Aliiroseovarius subalbicans]